MKAELRYKTNPENSCLVLYGAYSTDEFKAAVKEAGWKFNEFGPSMIPVDLLESWMSTDEFNQPTGTGLFGGSTKSEWEKNIAALKTALNPLGIKLGKPRQFSSSELL